MIFRLIASRHIALVHTQTVKHKHANTQTQSYTCDAHKVSIFLFFIFFSELETRLLNEVKSLPYEAIGLLYIAGCCFCLWIGQYKIEDSQGTMPLFQQGASSHKYSRELQLISVNLSRLVFTLWP